MHFATLVNVECLGDIDSALEPFACEASSEYMEFVDKTDDIKARYETDEIMAIKLPNGKIIGKPDLYKMKLMIEDDKIVEFDHSTGTYCETDKSKELTILGKRPAKDVYKTFRSYASKCADYSYDKEHRAYGYYSNPNAQWDWFEIGGRWSGELLVKKSNDDVLEAAKKKAMKAPRGYKWVDGAKISDIAWGELLRLKINNIIRAYYRYSKFYLTGEVPKNSELSVDRTNHCIKNWDSIVYQSTDTLDDFMKRSGFQRDIHYIVPCENFLNIYNEWNSRGYSSSSKSWKNEVSDYIAACNKDSYLVVVDCHI